MLLPVNKDSAPDSQGDFASSDKKGVTYLPNCGDLRTTGKSSQNKVSAEIMKSEAIAEWNEEETQHLH
jgi:hypothetical protein